MGFCFTLQGWLSQNAVKCRVPSSSKLVEIKRNLNLYYNMKFASILSYIAILNGLVTDPFRCYSNVEQI